jgi:hypothetical protein
MPDSNSSEGGTKPIVSRRACANCSNLRIELPNSLSPYGEAWCSKQIYSLDFDKSLEDEIDCVGWSPCG